MTKPPEYQSAISPAGILYLVATPIGNLEDLSARAVRILKEVDVILCEDTRRARTLCRAWDVATPLMSYYREIEETRIPWVLNRLREGGRLALISDAGMPGVQDPGSRLVRAVWEAGGRVTVVPGPSAVTAALALSGLPTVPFIFWGYVPRARREREKFFRRWATTPVTHVAFETGRRLKQTLEFLSERHPHWELCLVKELTKVHETRIRGVAAALMKWLAEDLQRPRGEWVLLTRITESPVEEGDLPPQADESLWNLYRALRRAGTKPRTIARWLSALTGIPANRLYRRLAAGTDPEDDASVSPPDVDEPD